MVEEMREGLSFIQNRKSVRVFLEREVEEEKLQQIYDAILVAPTTETMMMYSVIRVKDMDLRMQLSRQPVIRKAPLVLVFCADYRRWNKVFSGLPQITRKPQEGEYQLALIDAVIAAQNAVLAAEALGLSSVYLGDIMEHYEERSEALGCPIGVVPVLTLCIGYATQKQLERSPIRRYGKEFLIFENTYQDFTRDELLEMIRDRGQYEDLSSTQEWLDRFSLRIMEGKGALERTRSIRAAMASWENSYDNLCSDEK